MTIERPPLGLMSKKFWLESTNYQRVLDVIDAMSAYAEAERACPEEWVTELSERVRLMRNQWTGREGDE